MLRKLKCALWHRRKMWFHTPAGKRVLFLCFDCTDNHPVVWMFQSTGMPPGKNEPELRN